MVHRRRAAAPSALPTARLVIGSLAVHHRRIERTRRIRADTLRTGCNREHFGDRVTFEPFIDQSTGRVVWLNSFAGETTVVEWESAMRESGIRAEVIGPVFEVVSVELLTPITDPRLDELKRQAVELRSLLS